MNDPVAEWLDEFNEIQKRSAREPRFVPLGEVGSNQELSDAGENDEASENRDERLESIDPEEQSRKDLLASLNRQRRDFRGRAAPPPSFKEMRKARTRARKEAIPRAPGPLPENWNAAKSKRRKAASSPPQKPFAEQDQEHVRKTRDRYHTRSWYAKQLLAVWEGKQKKTDQQFAALVCFGRLRGWHRRPPDKKLGRNRFL